MGLTVVHKYVCGGCREAPRDGGNHDVWTDGDRLEYVPRHAELNEILARKILAKAMSKKGRA